MNEVLPLVPSRFQCWFYQQRERWELTTSHRPPGPGHRQAPITPPRVLPKPEAESQGSSLSSNRGGWVHITALPGRKAEFLVPRVSCVQASTNNTAQMTKNEVEPSQLLSLQASIGLNVLLLQPLPHHAFPRPQIYGSHQLPHNLDKN